jgi:hypothetical protein
MHRRWPLGVQAELHGRRRQVLLTKRTQLPEPSPYGDGREHADELRRDKGRDAGRSNAGGARAIVTAGFANDVEAVNQYAAVTVEADRVGHGRRLARDAAEDRQEQAEGGDRGGGTFSERSSGSGKLTVNLSVFERFNKFCRPSRRVNSMTSI